MLGGRSALCMCVSVCVCVCVCVSLSFRLRFNGFVAFLSSSSFDCDTTLFLNVSILKSVSWSPCGVCLVIIVLVLVLQMTSISCMRYVLNPSMVFGSVGPVYYTFKNGSHRPQHHTTVN